LDEFVKEAGDSPTRATQERLTRMIRDNVVRLDKIVQDVLQLNRRDRANVVDIALEAYLRNLLDEWALAAQVPVSSVVLAGDLALTVRFDREHLTQILWNLLANAWRHGAKDEGAVQLAAVRSGARAVELWVADSGPGISEEDVAHVFEPFFTTHDKGSGLGLYIGRELAEANGAQLAYVPPNDRPDLLAPDVPRLGGAHFRLTVNVVASPAV
jgi:two-component system, NtrC family, sensor histidine kinase PilS